MNAVVGMIQEEKPRSPGFWKKPDKPPHACRIREGKEKETWLRSFRLGILKARMQAAARSRGPASYQNKQPGRWKKSRR